MVGPCGNVIPPPNHEKDINKAESTRGGGELFFVLKFYTAMSACELRVKIIDLFDFFLLFSLFLQTKAVQGRIRRVKPYVQKQPVRSARSMLSITQRQCLKAVESRNDLRNYQSCRCSFELHHPEEEVPITKENLRHKSRNSQ